MRLRASGRRHGRDALASLGGHRGCQRAQHEEERGLPRGKPFFSDGQRRQRVHWVRGRRSARRWLWALPTARWAGDEGGGGVGVKWVDGKDGFGEGEVQWYRPSLELARRKMSLSWDRKSVVDELKGWAATKGESTKFSEACGFYSVELSSPPPGDGNGDGSNRMSGMTLVGVTEVDAEDKSKG